MTVVVERLAWSNEHQGYVIWSLYTCKLTVLLVLLLYLDVLCTCGMYACTVHVYVCVLDHVSTSTCIMQMAYGNECVEAFTCRLLPVHGCGPSTWMWAQYVNVGPVCGCGPMNVHVHVHLQVYVGP